MLNKTAKQFVIFNISFLMNEFVYELKKTIIILSSGPPKPILVLFICKSQKEG